MMLIAWATKLTNENSKGYQSELKLVMWGKDQKLCYEKQNINLDGLVKIGNYSVIQNDMLTKSEK